jgi:hypothetical protein
MADAADSKSVGRKPVKVRLLSPADPPSRFLGKSAILAIYKAFCTVNSARLCNRMKQKSGFWGLIGYTGYSGPYHRLVHGHVTDEMLREASPRVTTLFRRARAARKEAKKLG